MMDARNFSAALGGVRDEYVSEAITYQNKQKRRNWTKWMATAACLCLVVGLAFPLLSSKGSHDATHTGDDAPFFFNGCYYEVTDAPEVLAQYGLPRKITPDMAGAHVAYIKVTYDKGFASFEETAAQADIELCTYAPAPSSGVYVYREGETYMAAIFCNFELFGSSNTNYELAELYRVYAVEGAEDIVSVAEVDWGHDEIIGTPVTDTGALAVFYTLTTALPSVGNDDFQRLTFGGVSDEAAQDAHTAFADDLRILRVETSDGLYFYVSFYPAYSWLYSSGTMSYYRMEAQMDAWFSENFG